MSPPFGHSNTQDRAGRCCSSAELLAPTWPRRSLNTPTVLTSQTLKPCFPRHTSLRTKEDEVEKPRLSSSRTWEQLREKGRGGSGYGPLLCSGERRQTLTWAERMRLVFPRAETRRILRPDTRGLKEPHLPCMRSRCTYVYTSTDQTNPGLENLRILSMFTSSIHPWGSNCVSVHLRVREREQVNTMWREAEEGWERERELLHDKPDTKQVGEQSSFICWGERKIEDRIHLHTQVTLSHQTLFSSLIFQQPLTAGYHMV